MQAIVSDILDVVVLPSLGQDDFEVAKMTGRWYITAGHRLGLWLWKLERTKEDCMQKFGGSLCASG